MRFKMTDAVKDLVQAVLQGDTSRATEIAQSEIQQRVTDQIDAQKADVLQNVWTPSEE